MVQFIKGNRDDRTFELKKGKGDSMLYANSNVNINSSTGIRYGVIAVSKAIDLYNKILEEGEDMILSSMIRESKNDLELSLIHI